MSGKTVIIIGAGTGGCAIAARLAKEGFNVTVYEKNSFGGGRCSLLHANGHRFDQGPSFYLMPKIFEETFRDLDENLNDHVELLKCKTNYNVYFHDGKTIELTCDLATMCANIEKFEQRGEATVRTFLSYLEECREHLEGSTKLALMKNYPSFFYLITLKNIVYAFRLHLLNSVYSRATKYFKTDYMRKAFTFQTMYLGMSPFEAPGAYSLLQGTEFTEGIWYPKGGFYQVLKAFENIAVKKYNAEFKYNCGVKEINIDKETGEATGVTLEDGTVANADIVVCNVDTVYAYNKLLPKTTYGSKLGSKGRLTSSSISFYWCMKQKLTQFTVHNIFIAEKYKESFDQIFNDNTLPDEASFYVNVPSRIDPTAAPENKDTFIVLVPVGHLNDKNQSKMDDLVREARRQVIETIEQRLKIKNFGQYIEHEIVNDPRTWMEKFNLWRGNILGLTHSIFQVLYFRPAIKCNLFKKLYFCGASVHPGTGVPIILYGAKLATEKICEDFGLREKKSEDNRQNVIFAFFLLLFFSAFVFKFFF